MSEISGRLTLVEFRQSEPLFASLVKLEPIEIRLRFAAGGSCKDVDLENGISAEIRECSVHDGSIDLFGKRIGEAVPGMYDGHSSQLAVAFFLHIEGMTASREMWLKGVSGSDF
jgi:hypothetical protein